MRKQKISIIGYTGFIGTYLCRFFNKEKFIVKKINLRQEKISKLPISFFDKILQSDIIVNAAASLNPKSKDDFYLNELFPKDLSKINKKHKKKIIHLSTINVLIKDRLDKYLTNEYISHNTSAGFLSTTSWQNFKKNPKKYAYRTFDKKA